MVRKLVVMVMAVLFSLSVSGLGFAAEEKPAATPAEKGAPAQPCAGAEKGMKKKAAKKKEEGATPATPATPPSK